MQGIEIEPDVSKDCKTLFALNGIQTLTSGKVPWPAVSTTPPDTADIELS